MIIRGVSIVPCIHVHRVDESGVLDLRASAVYVIPFRFQSITDM